jgi:AraC family transcriptional regulator
LENLAVAQERRDDRDELAAALRRKAESGVPGTAVPRVLVAADSWRVVDIVCTSGPRDPSFEERQAWTSISLVLSGTFTCRSDGGRDLLSAGSWLLVNAEQTFECSHDHGEGDRCLSFQFHPELFERLAHDAGAAQARFPHHRLPPLRRLAPLTARAAAALEPCASLEEIALDLAGAALGLAYEGRPPPPAAGDPARIAQVLRRLESHFEAPHSLSELAASVKLSPYYFLRVFKGATGITPHQWLLRTRLREAARRLATTGEAVTRIALDVGFEDLSNFIRSFRAEFGVSPGRYRTRSPAADERASGRRRRNGAERRDLVRPDPDPDLE